MINDAVTIMIDKRMWQDKKYSTHQLFYTAHPECRSEIIFESFYFRRTVEGTMHSTQPLPPSFHSHNTHDPSASVVEKMTPENGSTVY
jgi:hypothetical protein